MARKTIQYVVEISHDDEQISALEADLKFRETLADALSGIFPAHVGRVV